MRINVPDDVVETYNQYAEQLHCPADLLMAEQLARFAHMKPGDRFITLNSAILGEIEAIVHGGSILSPRDLLTKVQRLADIQIGGVRVVFSPAALEELVTMADKQGLSVEELTRRTVERMASDFFYHCTMVTVDPSVQPVASR